LRPQSTSTQEGSHDLESRYAARPPRVAAKLRHDARRRSCRARRAGAGTGARDIRRARGRTEGREQRMLIVDAQIHIWKSSKPNPNHRQIADYSADDALKEMDEAGVTAAVIHPPGWDPNANALAVEAARQHPNRFATLGNFPLDRPESRSLIDGWKGRPG